MRKFYKNDEMKKFSSLMWMPLEYPKTFFKIIGYSSISEET